MSKSVVPGMSLNSSSVPGGGVLVMASFVSGVKTVQALRIVHEDALLHGRVGREQRDEINQVPVIRHVPRDVRMRPIRAPQDAIRRSANEFLREGHGIGERWSRARNPLSAA